MANLIKRLSDTARFWQISTVIFLGFLIVNQTSSGLIHFNSPSHLSDLSVVETVQASEIYLMFTCPCCGQPLNKEEPCCGAMTQMIDFIDQQISLDKSKDEIVLTTAKEFGLDRLTNKEDRIALKQKLADLAPDDAPKIDMSETSRDLGEISQAEGEVTTEFEFRNSGESDLIINKLSSSCGCTSAGVVYNGEVGPTFTMPGHGKENPTDWQVAIKPDDSAILRVFYDPNAHGDFVGAVTRTVSVFSNDPVEFETKITITLDQTK